MEQREQRVMVETNRYRITGLLSLPRDGYRSRLTDYLNASERDFLALTDVSLEPLDGRSQATRHEFVAVSLNHVVLALPSGD